MDYEYPLGTRWCLKEARLTIQKGYAMHAISRVITVAAQMGNLVSIGRGC